MRKITKVVDIETGAKLYNFLQIKKEENDDIFREYVLSGKVPLLNFAPLIYWESISEDEVVEEYLKFIEDEIIIEDKEKTKMYLYLFKYLQKLLMVNQLYQEPSLRNKKIDFDNMTDNTIGNHFVCYANEILDSFLEHFDALECVSDFFNIIFEKENDLNWIKVFTYSGRLDLDLFLEKFNLAMSEDVTLSEVIEEKSKAEDECFLGLEHCALAFALIRKKYKLNNCFIVS
jgi:hypothetical protein